jgi:hypothetical protein
VAECRVGSFGVVVDAPILDDRLCLSETVKDLAIEAFVPELLCRPDFLAGHGNRLALSLQYLNLARLRHNLLSSKSLPGHLLSPFQFNTLISSVSEKAGQVISINDQPRSERMAMAALRVEPVWHTRMAPELKAGKQLLVVAHTSSIRGLARVIEGLSDEEAADFRIATATCSTTT